jgi:hypothetical protein
MSSFREAWDVYGERRSMIVLSVDELVTIGKTCGVSLAEHVYLSLAREPTEHGERVDWLTIQARILSGA